MKDNVAYKIYCPNCGFIIENPRTGKGALVSGSRFVCPDCGAKMVGGTEDKNIRLDIMGEAIVGMGGDKPFKHP